MFPRSILLFGRSLLLSLVTASLKQVPDLDVTHVVTWAEVQRLTMERIPDVLIFELDNSYESHILPLLLKAPHLRLIGLDSEHDQGLLLSGQRSQTLTMDQIREIIGGPV